MSPASFQDRSRIGGAAVLALSLASLVACGDKDYSDTYPAPGSAELVKKGQVVSRYQRFEPLIPQLVVLEVALIEFRNGLKPADSVDYFWGKDHKQIENVRKELTGTYEIINTLAGSSETTDERLLLLELSGDLGAVRGSFFNAYDYKANDGAFQLNSAGIHQIDRLIAKIGTIKAMYGVKPE